MRSVAALALLAPATVSAGFLSEKLGTTYLSREMYQSGAVHEALMGFKMDSFAVQEAAGAYNSSQYALGMTEPVRCIDGLAIVEEGNANKTFRCDNMDLHDFKTHAELGSTAGRGSSSWGWESKDGREFAAIGQSDGAAFVEITKSGRMLYLGRLPQQSVPSQWREIRVYRDYFVIGSEAVGHGVQFFDAKKLLTIDPAYPKVFSTTDDIVLWNELPVGRAHNVVVNEEAGYAVAVGAQPRNSTCASGLIFIDLTDPQKPFSPGCAPNDGYVHDAQCLVYRGPDKRYEGREVCYGSNENTLTIYDVTDKKHPTIISNTTYFGARYTHQSAVLDVNNQEYLIIDDEIDEEDGVGPAADGYPVTYIFDIRDLEKPVNTGIYKANVKGIDHNQYVHNGLSFQSNYGSGLRVIDVSSIPRDPTGKGVNEVSFFDIYPQDDQAEGGGIVQYAGTWSHHAFRSGYVMINTIESGAFVVRNNKVEGLGSGEFWSKEAGYF